METDNNQNQPTLTSISVTAIICWVLAGFGGAVAFFKVLNSDVNSYYMTALIGSSLTLLWMGHIVNYLKQISDKK